MKRVDNTLLFAEAQRLLTEGVAVRIRLEGHSMEPLLRPGRDVLLLEPCTAETLRPGDVVLFRYRGRTLLHRLVRREGETLWFEGDGNYRTVEQAATGDAVARLAGFERGTRFVSCDGPRWRRHSRLWRALPAPMRRLTLSVWRRVHGIR